MFYDMSDTCKTTKGNRMTNGFDSNRRFGHGRRLEIERALFIFTPRTCSFGRVEWGGRYG